MIINHRYKFIFVKTFKTAGTSVEIALSEFCESGDIITPITNEDESVRESLGFAGPQNTLVPFTHYHPIDWLALIARRKRRTYYNHLPAASIKRFLSKRIWDTYFKFCFERNPFDKAISRYYWSNRNASNLPDLNSYLATASKEDLSNWHIYTINNSIAVNFVGRYEYLQDDLTQVSERLGLPKLIKLPFTKNLHRTNRSHYSKLLNAQSRARIETVCAREINSFSYKWVEDPVQ